MKSKKMLACIVITIGVLLSINGGVSGRDVGDPRKPVPGNNGDGEYMDLVGRWAYGNCRGVTSVGDTAYFGNGGYLDIVDFSSATMPVELGKLMLLTIVNAVDVSGNYAYICQR